MNDVVSEHTDYADFPVGTKVRIVTPYLDSYFWFGETGEVVANSGQDLGITVQFDKPRKFKGGYVQTDFGFDPENLAVVGRDEKLFEVNSWTRERIKQVTNDR